MPARPALPFRTSSRSLPIGLATGLAVAGAVFTMHARRIRLALVSTDEFERRHRRFLPEVALLAGLGITFLLGLSVHLARTAYTNLRHAEVFNRRLVEDKLKVSDERLRLAFDSAQLASLSGISPTTKSITAPAWGPCCAKIPARSAPNPEA